MDNVCGRLNWRQAGCLVTRIVALGADNELLEAKVSMWERISSEA
jgi:hypothetical protein